MARPRNPDGERWQGFPAGVNNVAPEHDAPTDEFGRVVSLREAVNVDLVGPKKKPRRRSGRTRILSGRCHSPAVLRGAGTLLVVVDGDLRAYDRALDLQATVRAAVGGRYLTYAQVNDDLYWSSPSLFRRVRADGLVDEPGWIDCAGTPQAEPYADGAFRAGTYRVGMTWLDADGRESGCLGLAEVDLADNQGIRVFGIPPAPEGAVTARVYVSAADSEELYAAADLLTTVTNTVITSGGKDGVTLKTLWRQTLPPCEILRFWNERLLGASGNLLVWSDALRIGLTTHDNYMRFGQRITMLEPVGHGASGAGLYIADHKNTYWLDGPTPKDWKRVIKLDVPAVPGMSVVLPGNKVGLDTDDRVVVWLGANGVFYAGLPGGNVQPLTEGRLALPNGEEGAMVFREYAGLQQLIASYIRGTPSNLAIGDRASASVTRYTT